VEEFKDKEMMDLDWAVIVLHLNSGAEFGAVAERVCPAVFPHSARACTISDPLSPLGEMSWLRENGRFGSSFWA
jgi:hypothetical protein